MQAKKVALAYSGGLDTSIIIPWLKENYHCEVVAVCGDIGQGDDELKGLEAKARKTGASEVHIADMREEFVREYLWRLVRAGAVYEHKYLLGTSVARPLLAKRQVEVALATGCDALAHGCTGKGNDQVRFELTYKALAPQLKVIAPWREWDIVSREDAIDYAAKHDVPISQTTTKIYSRDRNILENLLSNAIKFTSAGSVTVTVRDLPETRQVQFQVDDTGPGIDERDLPTIFEPFRQIDGSSTRRHGGVGLGLAMVQRYTHLLDGTIDVHSIRGGGSSFVLTLPHRPRRSVEATSPHRPAEQPVSGTANRAVMPAQPTRA